MHKILEDKYVQNYMGKIAEKFHEENFRIFKNNGIDLEDLKQESYVAMIDTIEKTEGFNDLEKEHQMKLLTMGVVWHFKIILRDNKPPKKGKKDKKNEEFNEEILAGLDGFGQEKQEEDKHIYNPFAHKVEPEAEEVEFYGVNALPDTEYTENFDRKLMMDDIKDLLDERSFDILYKHAIEGRTLREIAEEYSMSYEGVRKIYNANIKKLKKIAKKDGL